MSKFQFESPNYTMTPNDLFDDLLKQIDDMSELKVTLMAVRMTIGYHKDAAELSVEYLHQATGLAKNSVRRGLALAIRRGTIRVVKKSTNRTGGIYALNVGGAGTDTLEVQALNPLKKERKNNKPPLADAPTDAPSPEASPENADEQTAWEEVRTMLVVVSPVVIEEFRECWQGHPDLRRHKYALKQTKDYANPVSWKYYKTIFERYDPDKVKPAPAPKQGTPRGTPPPSTGFKIEVFADGSFYG